MDAKDAGCKRPGSRWRLIGVLSRWERYHYVRGDACFALDMTDEFETLFNSRTYQSIDDILKAELPKQRKRGNKNG